MILGKSNYSTTNKFERVQYNISIESCGYTSIISDTTEELAQLESALYVADIMLEERALEGATEAELDVMLEGVMSSFYTRLKQAIQKLIAKIKEWFANVKKFFQVLFSHGKDFAKQYKVDIMRAASKCNGYKYKTYKFYKPWRDIIDLNLTDEVTDNADVEAFVVAEDLIKANPNESSNAELVKIHMRAKFWKDTKADSQAEHNKETKETVFGGSLEREEFEDFKEGPTVTDMLYALENGSKAISSLDKLQRAIERNCNNFVRDIEKEEKEAAKKAAVDGTELSKAYSLAADILKATANHAMSEVDIAKEAVKTASKDAESILKGLLRHKPRKEGFEPELEDGSENVLEAAFRCL